MRLVHVMILLSFVAACGGHPRDCPEGVNMTAPRVVGALDVLAPEPTLRIEWDPGTGQGASLPDAYFARPEVVIDDYAPGISATASYQAPRSLTVTFHGLPEYLADRTELTVTVLFPDRAAYIECHHPGSADAYVLEFALHFTDEGQLDDASFRQWIAVGPV